MANPTPLTDDELCARYGVAIYAAADFRDCPPHLLGKYEVTWLAGDFQDAPSIPPAGTYDAAASLAVERLGLAALYAAEPLAEHCPELAHYKELRLVWSGDVESGSEWLENTPVNRQRLSSILESVLLEANTLQKNIRPEIVGR